MAVIVGVHGAFHELWGPRQVRARWRPALHDGILLAGGDPGEADTEVEIAFYGDLFRHDPQRSPEPDDDALRGLLRDAGLSDALRERFGDDILGVLGQAMGEDLMRRMVDQIGRYFTDEDLRTAIRARVERAVGDDTRVVVAHSLGTIVAYDALTQHPEWPVETFVTIGSPLGRGELVLSRLGEPDVHGHHAWPGGVQRWVNLAATTDPACAGVGLAASFGPRVLDIAIDNGHRGHDPEPYLCATPTGTAVLAGLRGAPAG